MPTARERSAQLFLFRFADLAVGFEIHEAGADGVAAGLGDHFDGDVLLVVGEPHGHRAFAAKELIFAE